VKNFFGFLGFVARKFQRDRCLQSASSLTTTTLFALVPLITISLSIYSLIPGFAHIGQAVHGFLTANMLPDAASRIVSAYMTQFSQHASQLTYAGLALLTMTVFSLAITVDHTFNAIWGTAPRHSWPSRLVVYAIVILMGPLLLGLILWAMTLVVSTSLGWVGEASYHVQTVLKGVWVGLLALGFALVYYTVPGHPVKGRHAMLGGVLAALLFEGMRSGFTFFMARFSTYKLVYGAFAAFPIFLLWIEMSWAVVLFCAVLTACLPLWRNQAWRIAQEEPQPETD
jgi:membrane protein